jgi:3-deoxy-D-manno-octulosonate 8-phosphate phosphatase (KDO 8-P phosphatase)
MSQSCSTLNGHLAGKLDLIAFDFDGVLTDNRVLVIENGVEAVLCNRSDGLAFDMFRAAGIPLVIISTERNGVVSNRAEKLQVPVLQAITNKQQALQDYCRSAQIDLARVAFVGNDVNDLPAMKIVGFPIAVADAHPAVKEIACILLATSGGDGVAREIAEQLLGLRYDAALGL